VILTTSSHSWAGEAPYSRLCSVNKLRNILVENYCMTYSRIQWYYYLFPEGAKGIVVLKNRWLCWNPLLQIQTTLKQPVHKNCLLTGWPAPSKKQVSLTKEDKSDNTAKRAHTPPISNVDSKAATIIPAAKNRRRDLSESLLEDWSDIMPDIVFRY